MAKKYLTQLRENLEAACTLLDLETLCFDLEIDHTSFERKGRVGMAFELVATLSRAKRIHELVALCQARFPAYNWQPTPITEPAPAVTIALAPPPPDPMLIREALMRLFPLNDLRLVCIELGVKLDELDGCTRGDKVLSLVALCREEGRLEDLGTIILRWYPDAY
jgi:hypothetical protein